MTRSFDVSKLPINTIVPVLVMPSQSTFEVEGPCTRVGVFIGRCRGRAIVMLDNWTRQVRVRECLVAPDSDWARRKVERWIAGQERHKAHVAKQARAWRRLGVAFVEAYAHL